jgi:Leucine-rich repeat (LRR) protein
MNLNQSLRKGAVAVYPLLEEVRERKCSRNYALSAFFMCCLLSFFESKSQFVVLPDTNFVNHLKTSGLAQCFQNNLLDTTCNDVLNITAIDCSSKGITDISGVKYFKNLKSFAAKWNQIQSLPELPYGLISLDLHSNNVTNVAHPLPTSLRTVTITSNNINTLPVLPDSLTELNCSYNSLSNLNTLPANLTQLNCSFNQLSALSNMPVSLIYLNCSNNPISSLSSLPPNLEILYCKQIQVAALPSLPNSLKELTCSNNNLLSLPALQSAQLESLDCSFNQLNSLPDLPNTINTLYCNNNQLNLLPPLPQSLISLFATNNQLTVLDTLPNSLADVFVNNNLIQSIVNFPTQLVNFNAAINQLSSLPSIITNQPINLLDVSNNQLTSFPSFTNYTSSFSPCEFVLNNNQLTQLTIPDYVETLDCSFNQIQSIKNHSYSGGIDVFYCNLIANNNNLNALPIFGGSILDVANNNISFLQFQTDTLTSCNLSNNPIKCLPDFKSAYVQDLNFQNTLVSCISGYQTIINSQPALNALPSCYDYNPDNCPVNFNVSGRIINDTSLSCILLVNTNPVKNIPVMLLKNGLIQEKIIPSQGGYYSFKTDTGNFEVTLDTISKAIKVSCPIAEKYNYQFANPDTVVDNQNFKVLCDSFDIGVVSIVNLDAVFRPAQFSRVKIAAGDLSKQFNLSCAKDVSGKLKVFISGNAKFKYSIAGSLTPAVVSDTLIYTIPDFSLIDFDNAFQFAIQTDTFAQAGQQVCISAFAEAQGDINPANNNLSTCFTIINSYDPNIKTVTPETITDTADLWHTYTIHFQNTGNAPAINISITDTLESNLIPSSFQLLSQSHDVETKVISNFLRFNFYNINLPDSNSNSSGSKGYVQFRIKRKSGLSVSTEIKNKAAIYFDFNEPIITNEVKSSFANLLALKKDETTKFKVFPNPATSNLTIEFEEGSILNHKTEATILNVYGQQILSGYIPANTTSFNFDVNTLSSGLYFLLLKNSNGKILSCKFLK